MRHDSQDDLALLVGPQPSPQCRAQPALAPREPALDLPPLAVHPAMASTTWLPAEPPHHLPPVTGLRPPPAGVAPVQRDDRRPDAQPLAAQGVVVLGVVAGVAQQRIQPAAARGGSRRRLELRRVLARAAADVGRQVQVTLGLQDRRQLGPGALPATLAGTPGVVAADVPRLEAGGVDGRPRLLGDQAACPRRGDGPIEQSGAPFFSDTRRAARWSVEWSGTSSRPSTSRSSAHSMSICSSPR
jgi:hypothetical protein